MIPASTLVDLFFGYDWSKYSAELFATNVFDDRNQLSRFVVCSICTRVKIVPGRPRTVDFDLAIISELASAGRREASFESPAERLRMT